MPDGEIDKFLARDQPLSSSASLYSRETTAAAVDLNQVSRWFRRIAIIWLDFPFLVLYFVEVLKAVTQNTSLNFDQVEL